MYSNASSAEADLKLRLRPWRELQGIASSSGFHLKDLYPLLEQS